MLVAAILRRSRQQGGASVVTQLETARALDASLLGEVDEASYCGNISGMSQNSDLVSCSLSCCTWSSSAAISRVDPCGSMRGGGGGGSRFLHETQAAENVHCASGQREARLGFQSAPGRREAP